MSKRKASSGKQPSKRRAPSNEDEAEDDTMPIEQDEETLEDDLGDGAEPSTQHMDAEPTEDGGGAMDVDVGPAGGGGDGGADFESEDEDEDADEDEDPLERDYGDDDSEDSGRIREAGQIHKIYVENFMNHRKLSVDFNKNINFIHGANGSGKSAILAALQICLGARVHQTHRGGSLAGLVRQGHNGTALVQVTLLNGGSDAYKPEVYGDKITIERTIGKNVSNYRILDSEGHRQGNQKHEVDRILDLLNIQVDNPCAILDQENAKEFIKGKDEDRYDFFARATNLNDILTSVTKANQDLREMRAVGAQQHGLLKKFADEKEQTRREYEDIKQILEIDNQIEEWRVNMFWATYEQFIKTVAECQAEVAKLGSKEEKYRGQLENAQASNGENSSEEELKEAMAKIGEQLDNAEKTAKEMNAAIQALQKPAKQAKQHCDRLKQDIKGMETEVKGWERQISEAKASAMGDAGEEERERLAQIEQVQSDIQARSNEEKKLSDGLANLEEDWNMAKDKLKQMATVVSNAKRGKSEVQNQVQSLERSEGTGMNLNLFGRNVTAILQKISQRRAQFEDEPVGPVGRHVKLAEGMMEWERPIEAAIGKTLKSFVVSNYRDLQVLKKIFRECNDRETEVQVVPKNARYNIAGKSPDGLLTIEQAILVDNDQAFNCLIEKCGIERCTLHNTTDIAEQTCFIGNHGSQQMLRNVFKAYAKDGSFSQLKNGNKFMRPHMQQGRPIVKCLGMDKGAQIAQLKSALAEEVAKVKEAEDEAKRVKQEGHGVQQEVAQLNGQLKEVGQRKRQAEKQLNKLRTEQEEAENNVVDTTDWEREVEAQQAKITAKQADLEEAVKNYQAKEEARKGKENEKRQYQKTMEETQAELDEKENAMAKIQQTKQEHKRVVATAQKKLDVVLEMKAKAEAALAKANDDAEEKREMAEEYMQGANIPDEIKAWETPVVVGKSVDYCKSKAKQLDERKKRGLKDIPKHLQVPGAAFDRAMAAAELYSSKAKEVKTVEKNCEDLTVDLRARGKKWQKLRKTVANLTNAKFDQTLNAKGHSGQVVFDYEKKTLSVVVQKDNRDSQSQITDPKLLSGGERSYVTLSLLISLGECIECPFRVMDEFDVFMDAVSRKKALETLIETGKKYAHRQFIFITPQDISSVTPSPMVKIHRMRPPGRLNGQQTLEEAMA